MAYGKDVQHGIALEQQRGLGACGIRILLCSVTVIVAHASKGSRSTRHSLGAWPEPCPHDESECQA